MAKIYEGTLTGKGKSFGLVVSRFNEFITKRLLDGAIDRLMRSGVADNSIEVIWVPGSFEVPLACLKMAQSNKFDAVIALGAVIRGETAHFEYVSSELAKGIARISLDTGIPVVFGVITTDTLEQAIDRAGAKSGNKGAHAAESAIEMANLLSAFEKK
ncbi:MAG: 6,7-dimethyl-8-ribityllumazine synthase [Candidatus Omnitrophica bacterium]|nr:6,7-dimethyl-8-ribityllumazine synthase [Candidatus Omnitrophota bacterium]